MSIIEASSRYIGNETEKIMTDKQNLSLEDRLLVSGFNSAESLKQAIRQSILEKIQNGWKFSRLFLQGRYLILKYEPGAPSNGYAM